MYDAAPQTVATGRGSNAKAGRPLDQIGVAADRLGKLTTEMEAFLVRFNGPVPEITGEATEIAVCYTTELARLHANIDVLSRQIEALCSIG